MSLYDSLAVVRDKFLLSNEAVNTDNLVFKLHRTCSVVLLLTFSILLSLSQYVGDPIDCIHDVPDMDDGTFDTFCWVEGTVSKRERKGPHQTSHLDKVRCSDDDDDEDCWHHKYYQWVAIVLVCQAGCFYLPRFLWANGEEGRIGAMVDGLDKRTLVRGVHGLDFTEGSSHEAALVRHLVANFKESMGSHNGWAVKYYFCELLNFLNVIGQFYFTNFFLDGQFNRIGLGGLQLEKHNSILPIMAECRFTMMGSGGAPSRYSGLCVLPLNMINQKFYTIFWLWLSILAVVSSVMLVLRMALIFSPEIRGFVIVNLYGVKDCKRTILEKTSHGDWLLLTNIVENMNPVVRCQFLAQLQEIKVFSVEI